MSRHVSPSVVALVAGACLLALASCSAGPRGFDDASVSSGGRSPSSHPAEPAVAGHCGAQGDPASVAGDVTVPDGATCELRGVRVEGNISVGHRARLYARGVDVDGDIEGEGTSAVEVTDGSVVGGNLQLESGGSAVVSDSHIGGDLNWEEQRGKLRAEGSTVSGNLELDGNTGEIRVSHNKIHGDLTCEENALVPVGGDNAVSGDEGGQCH